MVIERFVCVVVFLFLIFLANCGQCNNASSTGETPGDGLTEGAGSAQTAGFTIKGTIDLNSVADYLITRSDISPKIIQRSDNQEIDIVNVVNPVPTPTSDFLKIPIIKLFEERNN
jgi:hypothetical protein